MKDLVTFTEKILNGKLHFLCSESFFAFIQFCLISLLCSIDFFLEVSLREKCPNTEFGHFSRSVYLEKTPR